MKDHIAWGAAFAVVYVGYSIGLAVYLGADLTLGRFGAVLTTSLKVWVAVTVLSVVGAAIEPVFKRTRKGVKDPNDSVVRY